MDNKFLEFLKNLKGFELIETSKEQYMKLKEITSYDLPEMFSDMYSKVMPANEVGFSDFVFYGIDRIISENRDYIHGANVIPYGFFTFCSTFDGDAICFDLTQSAFPVYQCSHELLCDDSEITYYKNEQMNTLEFNYDNIIKVSPKLADSFDEFVDKLFKDDADTYGTMDIINMI